MRSASPGTPHFPRRMGRCQHLKQLFLKFEVKPFAPPACALSGLLTLGPECGHFTETLKEAHNAPVVILKMPPDPTRSSARDCLLLRLLFRSWSGFPSGLSGAQRRARVRGCYCWVLRGRGRRAGGSGLRPRKTRSVTVIVRPLTLGHKQGSQYFLALGKPSGS